ncbi:hypothetical protein HDV62DRAFT_95364 [Trichoderma sp. SZMC 28011]
MRVLGSLGLSFLGLKPIVNFGELPPLCQVSATAGVSPALKRGTVERGTRETLRVLVPYLVRIIHNGGPAPQAMAIKTLRFIHSSVDESGLHLCLALVFLSDFDRGHFFTPSLERIPDAHLAFVSRKEHWLERIYEEAPR